MISIRYLINANGNPFGAEDLKKVESALDKLDEKERKKYRDENAATISRHDSSKILIVSGPGTGKTHLFLDRIDHWLTNHQDGKVLVTSFVRKLVADLQNGIDNDQKLTKSQKGQTEVSTLHKFARSIVEKSNGTTNWKFKPHFRMISQSWKDVVWKDVLESYSVLDQGSHTWQAFESQLHNMAFLESNTWKGLRQTYFELCKFYNAAGFADLIVRAVDALRENSTLNTYDYLVIDEYQDFNLAEKSLIFELARNSNGLLIAGDDDQVLYEKLKSGKSEFIRKLYNASQIAKAMLPFCGRSSYHITKVAHHFIKSHSDSNRIEKVFLPLSLINSMKVQLVACACPSTAVDYIDKFISDNKAEIDERRDSILTGEERDAYLLILTPANDIKFYGRHSTTLQNIVSNYQIDRRGLSEDCYKVIDYASLGKNPTDNYAFRKVLHYEGVKHKKVHALVIEATSKQCNFCDLSSDIIKKTLEKARTIRTIIDSASDISEKIEILSGVISIKYENRKEIEETILSKSESKKEVESEDVEIQKMCAIEIMSIVKSKGLSADHVIIVGFDNVNMNYISENAFYVSLTRARKSLHILTSLKSGGATGPHKFLERLPETYMEFYSYRKSDHQTKMLAGKQGLDKYIKSISYNLKCGK